MHQKMRIGDYLLKSGVITEDQLNKALKAQPQMGLILGEVIVKLGFSTEEAIAQTLSKQLGVPYASAENRILKVEKGQNLDRIINEQFARDNLILPLFLDNNVLAVAMANPDNMLVLDNIRLMTGYEIQPFIATKAQILKAIDSFYQGSGSSLIEKVMETPAQSNGQTETVEEVDTSESRLDLDKVVAQARGAQVVSVVNAILKQAINERCSDIHLESYDEKVMLRFRVDGVLYERTPPAKDSFLAVVSRIKILSKLDIAEKRLPQDGTFSLKVQNRIIDLRVSTCPTVYGEKVVLRVLDKGAVNLSVDTIGFEPRQKQDFLKAAEYPHGLIFLTGPTGSGKTTTLYSILNTIKTLEKNFLTIEDPVEIKLEGLNQVQVKPQIGLTFAVALRSFLRQDPDVILVGEVRDQETAQTCLRAALTGHLVLSTLHTNDALSSVIRLIDLGIEPFLLSSSLALVAAQRLVRVLCPSCKRPYKPDAKELELCMKEAHLSQSLDPQQAVFYKAKGCEKCFRTGYMGRKGIYEVYLVNAEMRDVIYRHGGDISKLREVAEKSDMWNLRASGWRKVLGGVTTAEEVLSVTYVD